MPTRASKRQQHGATRIQDGLDQALLQLREKKQQYEAAQSQNDHLRRQVQLLQAAHQPMSLMQSLTMRSLVLPKVPAAARIKGLEVTGYGIPLDLLPGSLAVYCGSDAMLQRIECMSAGDVIGMYKEYLGMCQPLLLHSACHGSHSHLQPQANQLVRSFGNFVIVHANVALATLQPMMRKNLITGEDDAVPIGWYDRVAQLLPVHLELAQLAETAMRLVVSVNSQDECVSMAKISVLMARKMTAEAKDESLSVRDAMALDAAVQTYGRAYSSSVRFRNQLLAYVGSRMLSMEGLPLHMVGEMLAACWPFTMNLGEILRSYLGRPDVQAALAPPVPPELAEQRSPPVRAAGPRGHPSPWPLADVAATTAWAASGVNGRGSAPQPGTAVPDPRRQPNRKACILEEDDSSSCCSASPHAAQVDVLIEKEQEDEFDILSPASLAADKAGLDKAAQETSHNEPELTDLQTPSTNSTALSLSLPGLQLHPAWRTAFSG